MRDAVLFAIIFVGFFVLRLIAATAVFFLLLPEGDRCPNCDAHTIRVRSRGWNFCLPWLRTSWCYECGWHGMLRHGQADDARARLASAPPPPRFGRPARENRREPRER